MGVSYQGRTEAQSVGTIFLEHPPPFADLAGSVGNIQINEWAQRVEKSLVFLHGSIIATSAGVQGQIETVMRQAEGTLNNIVADAANEFQITKGTIDLVYNKHEYQIQQGQAAIETTVVEATASFERLFESDRELRSKLDQSFQEMDKLVSARFAAVGEKWTHLAAEVTRQGNAAFAASGSASPTPPPKEDPI